MKKLLGLALALLLLVGCSSGTTTNNNTSTNNTSTTSNVVENGDYTKIDFVGKLDGVAFNGGTSKNYPLEIGSGTFIDGFEDQIIGVKKGGKKTIKVTFPKNYQSTDLAGKEVTFDITVNELYKKVK
ncbi:MAG: FKBP-type peptidyl-prolyl cis-trans isomerase [Coprobacillus sp.]